MIKCVGMVVMNLVTPNACILRSSFCTNRLRDRKGLEAAAPTFKLVLGKVDLAKIFAGS